MSIRLSPRTTQARREHRVEPKMAGELTDAEKEIFDGVATFFFGTNPPRSRVPPEVPRTNASLSKNKKPKSALFLVVFTASTHSHSLGSLSLRSPPPRRIAAEADALQTTFEAFAAEHCGKFDFEAEEHKLVYQDVYKEYQATFEGLIEEHLKGKGADVEGFFAICKKVVEVGDTDRESFLPMLTAITDYDVFLGLMQESKEKMAEGGA